MPKFEQFNLPDLAEGLVDAEIIKWLVSEGDTVTLNQPIVEVETAKALTEIPSPYAGQISKLHHEEGATADVGQALVTFDLDPDGEPQGDNGQAPADPEDEKTATGRTAVLVGYGPKDVTAKRRPRKKPAAQAAAAPAAQPAAPPPPPPPPVQPAAPPPAQPAAPPKPAPAHVAVLAKPPVRKLAKDLGVDLATITGTGPSGSISRDDVHAAVSAPAAEPAPAATVTSGAPLGGEERIPIKGVRKATADNMVNSAFTAPHVTMFSTVDVTRMMDTVAHLKTLPDFEGVKVSPLLLVAKALLLAAKRHPMINSSWDEAAGEIVVKHYVNLGIAAATPRGLLVPNIKNAHRMGLRDLADAIADLTRTARSGKTPVAAMQDGTVTITNVGVFGIDTGTPILNPGESAILAFGAISQRPWVHKGKIKPRWVTQLALSFDHRLVDGELGSRVLADVAAVLERPSRALVWG